MRSRLAAMIVVTALTSLVTVGDQPARSATQSKTNQKKAARRSARAASLTGCIDEKDGQYVLVEERTLRTVAALEAESFPQEGFAKHLGHKVTVRGTMPVSGDRPLFKVRSVEKISDLCGVPQGAKSQ